MARPSSREGLCAARRSPSRATPVLLLLALALALHLFAPAAALMYPVTNNARVCLVEEVAENANYITGSYLWHPHPSNEQTKLTLLLRDPTNTIVDRLPLIAHTAKAGEDTFKRDVEALQMRAFTFPLQGDGTLQRRFGAHYLCLDVAPPITGIDPNNPIFLTIDVDQASAKVIRRQDEELEELKRLRKGVPRDAVYRSFINELSTQLVDLEAAASRLENNLDYETHRMSRMRQTSESTFTRVWVCALVTVIVVCIVVWVQFRWLSATIVKKKLI